ncbi:MAG: 3'-5' exonuclease [Candidatus Eisenbacteria bacterium]|uniref:3'-5' exonuclease n=1 Tax=Eiseniibacteriota bacterium TaxID=2212470 RepID=A0A849SI42_UNCEI|nr:3'-5' exonuclease [Candidatus Eisenbacteria bacterium]
MALLAGERVVVMDTETTGMSPSDGHGLVEVAAITLVDGLPGEKWSSLVRPGRPIPPDATAVHGITDAMVAEAPLPAEVARQLRERCGDATVVLHNAPFDLPFLIELLRGAGVSPLMNPLVDTLGLARGFAGEGGNSLQALRARYKLPAEAAHRALGDALTTARLLVLLADRWERERGTRSLLELAAASQDVMRQTTRRDGAQRPLGVR